jgi:hypothetical protein
MKEVLSLITFGIGALFFVVFFAAFRPDVVIAAPVPNKPGYCDTKAPPSLACHSLIFATALWPDVGRHN